MNLKRRNIVYPILAAGIISLLFSGCDGVKNSEVIDKDQLATQYYGNDAAWYLENTPFFECSDKAIEEVYYYRWKLYKAHIRQIGQPFNYVVTEFIDHVDWDKPPFATINAPSGHHIYEGRWLKDNRYLDGYIDYLYRGGGNDRLYSEWVADASYARYLVNGDSVFVIRQLPVVEHVWNMWTYHQWGAHYDQKKKLYFIYPGADATELSIADCDACGGTNEGCNGGEVYRPTINSYMFANALAISRIAAMKGDTLLSRIYKEKAAEIKANVQSKLWNESLTYFSDRYRANNQYVKYWDFIRGRELAGIVPWYCNLPDDTPKFNAAWKAITDPSGLLGSAGLRTVEPSYEYYMKPFRYKEGETPDCQWNGPSWPYQTSQALMGMANLLNNYTQDIITTSDYVEILRQYAKQHYMPDGRLNIVENYYPDEPNPLVTLPRSQHYLHSAFNDLVITGLCGIRPSDENTLTVHPLVDETISWFCLEGVNYHGHDLTLVYDADGSKYKLGKGLTVLVDGQKAGLKEQDGKYQLSVGAPVVQSGQPVPENLALNLWGKGYPAPSASVNNIPDSLHKATDGRIIYFPEVRNWWSTSGSQSATDWYAIDLGQPREISMVKLYLYADGKNYKTPESFSIEYYDGNQWVPVKETGRQPVSPTGNTVNEVELKKVTATQIRVNFKHGEKAVAVTEIECF